MLTEIQCTQFRAQKINFHNGLNVILGDEGASNSIGKSTTLMIIDFAFGGDDFIKRSPDIVSQLGHHYYIFKFLFESQEFHFMRGTENPDEVIPLTPGGESRALTISQYRDFLARSYDITSQSFRSFVGLFSRIWGKENLNVKRPLHVAPTIRTNDVIDELIKRYEKFSPIADLTRNAKILDEKIKSLNSAMKTGVISKITSAEHNQNLQLITEYKLELSELQTQLGKYTLNIKELVDKELLEDILLKDELLQEKLHIESKLKSLNEHLSIGTQHSARKNLEALLRFFPEIDKGKLAEVDSFHRGLSKILKNHIDNEKKLFTEYHDSISAQLSEVDGRIRGVLAQQNTDTSRVLLERIAKVTKEIGRAEDENRFHNLKSSFAKEKKELADRLNTLRTNILKDIETVINHEIISLFKQVYGNNRTPAKLDIGQANYIYEIPTDTGTGTAYSNLLILDLAIFVTTRLPLLIHDTPLFKNIEYEAIANLIQIYTSIHKQSFIAIDSIEKYGDKAATILKEKSVLQLGSNSTLYRKIWSSDVQNS